MDLTASEWLSRDTAGLSNALWLAGVVVVIVFIVMLMRRKCKKEGFKPPAKPGAMAPGRHSGPSKNAQPRPPAPRGPGRK